MPQIQEVMINILFHFARENPMIDYKQVKTSIIVAEFSLITDWLLDCQGMHELLAPLLFVIHCDHQTYLHAQEIGLIEY